LNQAISVVLFGVQKDHPDQVRETARALVNRRLIRDIKFTLFLDPEVDLTDLDGLTWLCANNIDPLRDCFFINIDEDNKYCGIFIDGTRKTFAYDHFEREWPNVILMDDETIQRIDSKWISLGLGIFFTSPSLKYKPLVINEGATFS
jgi:4-hydroxy-3-polyprenylbenzoate decarboxylase